MLRRVGYAAFGVGMSACYALSDFSGLDDGSSASAVQSGAVQSSASTGGAAQGSSTGDGMGGAISAGGAGGVGGTPACHVAQTDCVNASECCAPLACMVNDSHGSQPVCCGEAKTPCSHPMGADCCGHLWCDFTDSSPNQKICCGSQGEPCSDPMGKDCCGSLKCTGLVCTP